jgi:predicted DNA-binding transcriptional regulator AlpA
MTDRPALVVDVTPRGLRREMAARYVGLSPTKFDDLVKDGRMPKPKRVDGCVVWDRQALDAAFEELPEDGQEREWMPLSA